MTLETFQKEAFQEFERNLPAKWFKQLRSQDGPLFPFVWALAYALASARESIESARDMAIPARSEGIWLSLHMLGIGLARRASETDARALRRYQFEFEPSRNTRAGLLAFIREISGISAARLETDFARGRFGELRIVLEDPAVQWQEFEFFWLEQLLNQYVANGLAPSIDLRLGGFPDPGVEGGGELIEGLYRIESRPLLPSRFDTVFPMSFNQLGPLWERRAFQIPIRIERLARNLIAFSNAEEWAEDVVRLAQIFQGIRSAGAPGEQFYYLGEPNSASLEAVYQPSFIEVEQSFGARPFGIDGFRFDDVFPRQGNLTVTEYVEIEVRTYGLSPSNSNPFSGRAEQPSYALPAPAFILPSADDWRLETHSLSFAHEGIPLFWAQGGFVFGKLRQFPYNEEFYDFAGEVTRDIPDYAQVCYSVEVEPEPEYTEHWEMRGNYRQVQRFALLNADDYLLPTANDFDLPESYEPPTLLSVVEQDDVRIADFYSFERWSFVSTADPVERTEVIQLPDRETGCIPNVRSGFTRGQITEFFEVVRSPEVDIENDGLAQMGRGPWVLRLATGDPFPGGLGAISGEFAALEPASIWWTTADQSGRFRKPRVDDQGIARLAIEFRLSKQSIEQPLKEIQLEIGYPQPFVAVQDNWVVPDQDDWESASGTVVPELPSLPTEEESVLNRQLPVLEIVDYRELNTPIPAGVNWCCIYLVETRLGSFEVSQLPAFRSGQSRAGDPVRDRDYRTVVAA